MERQNSLCDENTRCERCPLLAKKSFRPFEGDELHFISHFKTGELRVNAGATILMEGSHSAHLYTVLSGWTFRHKILEDGRRQILNYATPGDLIGLQGSLLGEMQHSVEALTETTLCVFERERLMDLYRSHPSLAYDVTWIAAREERILDEHLLSVGRRTALERCAYLLAFLDRRARPFRAAGDKKSILPIRQSHVADTLGLSAVHTNKTLRKLAKKGLITWLDRACQIEDTDALAELAGWTIEPENGRPFL